ncbi:phage tail protein [Lacticaseibacillus parakribbianus]|uniref:phage tail protein n=1 Tax=Lacticaseibacillus parakribbianus TaxID=2970927 RepID=UPI0021CAE85A|nr:phage tail protein [Lacticaseibacillus parakribbianus]
MDFYFSDRKFNYLGTASAGGDGPIQIINDTDDQLVPTAVGRTYTGTLVTEPENSDQLETMAALGNFLLYQDPRGKYVFATIMEWPDPGFDPQSGTLEFVAESGGVDLINDTVGTYTATKALKFADYFKAFTYDSGFELGINEISNLTRTLKWDSGDETVLTRMESVATQFGAELDFRFEVDGTTVVKRYIDVLKHIGADKGQRMEVNTHLDSIKTTGSIYDLFTSIKATGGTPEGKDTPISLKGYKWTDPDGRYTLNPDDGILRDTVAVQLWSRTLSNSNPNPTAHHIQRVKTYTATTQASLLTSMLTDLKANNHAAVNYLVQIAVLPEGVEVGDTVHLVDEDSGLNLVTRLLELKDSYANETHEATFGDALIETSQIDPIVLELADQLKTVKAAAKGADGVGIESTTISYAVGTSGTDAPTDGYTADVPAVPAGQFLWTMTVFSYTDGTSKTMYAVSKAGADGLPGSKGDKGSDGNGITSTVITYAAGESGTVMPTSDWSSTIPAVDAGGYLWTKTVWTYTDKMTKTGYSVAKMGADGSPGQKGDQGDSAYTVAKLNGFTGTQAEWLASLKGEKGDTGKTGTPGKDGKTTYVHFAWANSLDGITDFATTKVTGKTYKYRGQCADFNEAAPTTPSSYQWSLDLSDTIEADLSDMRATAESLKEGQQALTTKLGDTNADITAVSKTVATAQSTADAAKSAASSAQTAANDAKGSASAAYAATQTNKASIDVNAKAIDSAVKQLTESADGLSSQLDEAMQQLDPDAITQTVLSSDEFQNIQDANDQDKQAIQDAISGLGDDASATVQRLSQVEQTAGAVRTTVDTMIQTVSDQGQTIADVQNSMQFDQDGLTLGKSDSALTINIDNKQMTFNDGGKQVAYVNGRKMYISDLQVLNSLTLGYHKISKYSSDGETTAVTFVGA